MPILIALICLGIATPFMVNRYRTGQLAANERAVVRTLRDYANAQDDYFKAKHEYAKSFTDLGGPWTIFPEIDAPLAADGTLAAPQTSETPSSGVRPNVQRREAHHGYRFRLLKGASGESGSKSYIAEDGRMTSGYAILAAPDRYGFTGKDTFLMSGQHLYVKDFEAHTDRIIQPLYHFMIPEGAKKIEPQAQ